MSFDGGNTSAEELNRRELAKMQEEGERIRIETEALNRQHQELSQKAPSDSIEEKFEEVRDDTKRLWQNIRTNTKIGLKDLRGFVSEASTDEERVLKNPKFFVTKIRDYTDFQAKVALKRSQRYYEKENSWGRAANTNHLSEIQSTSDRDAFQERLIKKMLGGKMYNSDQLAVYDNKIGYKLVNISDVEAELRSKDIDSIETEVLQRYILMLEDIHDGKAQEAIKKAIDITQLSDGGNSDIVRDALKFGGWRAKKIEEHNDDLTVEEVKGMLKKGRKSIKDPFLRRYIESEIVSLRALQENTKDWKGKSWSLLLLSLVMKQTSKLANIKGITVGAHNDAQDNIITEIQAEHPGEFIQGYNSETSNYLIKIDDFENYLRSTSTIITTGDPSRDKSNNNVVNSRAFANYIKYLSTTGNISINMLQQKIGTEKLKSLQNLWKPGGNKDLTLAQTLLSKTGLGKVFDMIQNFNPKEIIGSTLTGGEDYKISMNAIMLMDKKQHRDIIKFIEEDIQSPNGSLREYFIETVKDEEKVDKIMLQIEMIIQEAGTDINLLMRKLHELKTNENLEEMSIKDVTVHIKAEEHTQIRLERTRLEESKVAGIKLTPEEKIKLDDLERREREVSRQRFIINHMEEEDINDIATSKTTVEEVVERLRTEDEEFDKKMDIYEQIEEVQQKEVIEKENTEAPLENNLGVKTVSNTNGNFTIETPAGETIGGLTKQEVNTVSKSKEALNNLIDLKATLEELNLDFFWENRNVVFRAISNVNSLGLNANDGNYLARNEVKLLLSSIVYSIKDELGEKHSESVASLKNTGSIDEAKNLIMDINGESGILGKEDVNHFGDSMITKLFIDKFMPRESSQIFNHSRFQESLTS